MAGIIMCLVTLVAAKKSSINTRKVKYGKKWRWK